MQCHLMRLMQCHLMRLFIWVFTVCQSTCLPVNLLIFRGSVYRHEPISLDYESRGTVLYILTMSLGIWAVPVDSALRIGYGYAGLKFQLYVLQLCYLLRYLFQQSLVLQIYTNQPLVMGCGKTRPANSPCPKMNFPLPVLSLSCVIFFN